MDCSYGNTYGADCDYNFTKGEIKMAFIEPKIEELRREEIQRKEMELNYHYYLGYAEALEMVIKLLLQTDEQQ